MLTMAVFVVFIVWTLISVALAPRVGRSISSRRLTQTIPDTPVVLELIENPNFEKKAA